jgi:hypothetical protein
LSDEEIKQQVGISRVKLIEKANNDLLGLESEYYEALKMEGNPIEIVDFESALYKSETKPGGTEVHGALYPIISVTPSAEALKNLGDEIVSPFNDHSKRVLGVEEYSVMDPRTTVSRVLQEEVATKYTNLYDVLILAGGSSLYLSADFVGDLDYAEYLTIQAKDLASAAKILSETLLTTILTAKGGKRRLTFSELKLGFDDDGK